MRPASRLSLVPLSLIAILVETPALAVEGQIGGKPLVVDVTNTSILNYHFNNRNTDAHNITTIVDDDYGEWLDRLNVQASYWKFRLGVRIDGATFFSTPTPTEIRSFAVQRFPTPASPGADPDAVRKSLNNRLAYENLFYNDLHTRYLRAFYPSKLFVGFTQPGLDVTVGDFYAQLGRGLVFSARKIDELAVDTTVRGVKVAASHDFGDFRLGAMLFAGQMNPLRVDETSGRRLHGAGSPLFFGFPSAGPLTLFEYVGDKPEPRVNPARPSYFEDTVFGGHLEGGTKHFQLGGNTSLLARKIGAVGNNDPTKSHDTIATYSGSLSIPSLAKHGDVYVEVAGQSLRDGYLREPMTAARGAPLPNASGHAVYASASFNAGPVAISLEGKHYRNFFPLSGNTTAAEYNLLAYNQAPTVEPIYTEPVSGGAPNVCIDGMRGRVDYRFNRGASLYSWLGRYTSWTEKPGRAEASCTMDDKTRSNTWDAAVGTELSLEHGASHVRVWVGARTSDLALPDISNPRMDEPTSTFYREGYIRYDLVKHLAGRFSLQMQGFHRHRYEPFTYEWTWNEGENYTALQWSPHLSAVFGFEYKAKTKCSTVFHDAAGDPSLSDLCLYFNGGLTWRSGVGEEGTRTERILGRLFDTVSVFVGQRRGALRCVSGVCRQFPPFEGAKLEITSRF